MQEFYYSNVFDIFKEVEKEGFIKTEKKGCHGCHEEDPDKCHLPHVIIVDHEKLDEYFKKQLDKDLHPVEREGVNSLIGLSDEAFEQYYLKARMVMEINQKIVSISGQMMNSPDGFAGEKKPVNFNNNLGFNPHGFGHFN